MSRIYGGKSKDKTLCLLLRAQPLTPLSYLVSTKLKRIIIQTSGELNIGEKNPVVFRGKCIFKLIFMLYLSAEYTQDAFFVQNKVKLKV